MIRAAVIGHPVDHSLSPLIHNHWIGRYGLTGAYDRRDIASANLAAGIGELSRAGYAGFNVTVPHKQAVMALCTHIDDDARAVGAVNTVRIENGKLSGGNTDAFGFIENLRAQAGPGPWRVLILGAGGAARAAAHALQTAGSSDIVIANRTLENAKTLAAQRKTAFVPWEEITGTLPSRTLIVNTTVCGMTGQPPLAIDITALPDDAVVYDIVYKPLVTDLLARARQRGLRTVTGLGMLLQQARPAFAAWFGVMPEIDETLLQKVTEAAS